MGHVLRWRTPASCLFMGRPRPQIMVLGSGKEITALWRTRQILLIKVASTDFIGDEGYGARC